MSVRKLISLALLPCLLLASYAGAQTLPSPTVQTMPPGDNSNHAASTAYVDIAIAAKMPLLTANQILGNLGGANLALPVPSCATANSALQFTLAAGFSCATISSGSTTVPGGSNGQAQINSSGAFAGISNVGLTALIQPFSATLPGAVPASGGGTTNVLYSDGTWRVPPSPVLGVEIDFFYGGIPYSNALLAKTFSRPTTIAANAAIKCNAITGSTIATTVTFNRVPAGTSALTTVGTAAFAASPGSAYQNCTSTWASAVTFAVGDILTMTFPGTADITQSNIAISLPASQ